MAEVPFWRAHSGPGALSCSLHRFSPVLLGLVWDSSGLAPDFLVLCRAHAAPCTHICNASFGNVGTICHLGVEPSGTEAERKKTGMGMAAQELVMAWGALGSALLTHL